MTVAELHVLVLEDHGFQRRMAIRLLTGLGVPEAQVAGVADAESALAWLEAAGSPPDLILVDLDMPGMDGVQFLGHVAERRLARNIALVSAMDPGVLEAVRAMADASGLHILGVLQKPLTPEKLQALIADARPQVERVVAGAEPLTFGDGELLDALRAGDIKPWFQPQVDVANGKPVAVEALARWHRGGVVVPPLQFLPELDRLGLLGELSEVMLEQSCAWCSRWEARNGLRLGISINVSSSELDDPGIADLYLQVAARHGVTPGQVVIEMTESSLLADLQHGLGLLARLRLKGFGLSIDDFGIGYSSMGQLAHIPFTELKIDRVFVSNASTNSRSRAVVEASIDLARKMGLTAVAEGVETADDWQMLADLGCDLVQGHLITPPVVGEALPDALAAWRRPY